MPEEAARVTNGGYLTLTKVYQGRLDSLCMYEDIPVTE
jgi:hypothetical protein